MTASLPAEFPDELRPSPGPVAIQRHPPGPLDQIAAYIDEASLGLEPRSLTEVRALVRTLPAESSLVIVARLSARVNQLDLRANGQLDLAREFYGEGSLLDRLSALVRAEPSHRVFAKQQLLLLLWLLIVDARDDEKRELSEQEYGALQAAVLGCSSAVGELTRRTNEASSDAELLSQLIQLSAVYRREAALPPIVRARELLSRARDEAARDDPQFCPLDEWHADAYGLDVDEQLRLGFGLSAMTHAFDEGLEAGQRPYLASEPIDDFLVKSRLDGRRDRALTLISATRPQLARELGSEDRHAALVIWDATTFMRFPFLRCRDGGLILLSPEFAQSWFSEGFHFRSLRAAQQLDMRTVVGRKRESHAQRYLNFVGRVYERYCLDLARSVHAHKPVETARVIEEQKFSKSKRKRSGKGEKTSDIAIDLGPDLVLIETTASRFSLPALRTGDHDRVTKDLERAIVKKINQLDNCINQLVGGRAVLPGVDLGTVERIWPVIVSFGAVQQNPVLWAYLDRRAPNALGQARVRPLTLLDPEEYELLCGLVEAGHPLPSVLLAKTTSLYARMDFAFWISSDPHAPNGRPPRAGLLQDGFNQTMNNALGGIDFTADEIAA